MHSIVGPAGVHIVCVLVSLLELLLLLSLSGGDCGAGDDPETIGN